MLKMQCMQKLIGYFPDALQSRDEQKISQIRLRSYLNITFDFQTQIKNIILFYSFDCEPKF